LFKNDGKFLVTAYLSPNISSLESSSILTEKITIPEFKLWLNKVCNELERTDLSDYNFERLVK
jgi:hypothetical protein